VNIVKHNLLSASLSRRHGSFSATEWRRG